MPVLSTGNKRHGIPLPSRRESCLLIVPAVLIFLLVLGRIWWLPAHAPLDLNEGWNAGQTMRALGNGTLYPAPDALIANNYPPLSFYIVGGLGVLLGDHIVAGRILALLAQFATGGAIYMLVGRLVSDRRWATIAILLFGGFGVTLLRYYVGINDPQWLGHAAMSWALVLLMPREPNGTVASGRVFAAAALMLAGGLIKHNIVAIPIAATAWLWLTDRRAFMLWILSGALFAALACGALLAAWGTTVFVDVLAPARSYSLARLAAKGGPFLLAVLPAIIASRHLPAASRNDTRLALPLLLLIVAIPVSVLQKAGSGVGINAFFEAVIAVSIAVPVACALRPTSQYSWLGITILPLLCLLPMAVIKGVGDLTGRDAAVRKWAPFIARIAATRGPVACDDQAICYWAGRESALDFFAIKQRLLVGRGGALQPALDRGYFRMIQMRGVNPGWQVNLLTPAIHRRYDVVYQADGIELLTPKP